MPLISKAEELASNAAEYVKNKTKKPNKRKKLEDFWIKYKNQDLIEALEVFTDSKQESNNTQPENEESQQEINKIQQEISKIPQRLMEALTADNYLINQEKRENLQKEITVIKTTEEDKKVQNEKIQYILNQLSSEEMLSLFFYAYVYSFWKTQIIDKNDIEKLAIPKLCAPMPKKPENFPPKSQRENFSSKDEYSKELKDWKKKKADWEKAYKERANRSCEIKRKEDTSEYIKNYLTELFSNDIPNLAAETLAAISSSALSIPIANYLEKKYNPQINMPQEEEQQLEELIKNIETGQKSIIITNHDTFANIPAILIKIIQVAKKLWIKNINKLITTVIWDLIICNEEQEAAINSLSNIGPTSPTTNKIKWGNPIARQRRQNFTNYLQRSLIPWNNTEKAGKLGRLIIMAPSGTRDVIHRTKNGKTYIFIPDEEQISNKLTLPLLRNLEKEWVKIFAISTNTSEIKKPNIDEWVTTNNHQMNSWATVTMHFQELHIQNLSNWEIIDHLANHIYVNDKNKEPCGIKIPSDIFSYIKALTKDPGYSLTWYLPDELFIDEEKWELNFELIREKIKEKQQNKAA